MAALVVVVQPDWLDIAAKAWLIAIVLLSTGGLLRKAFGAIPPEPTPTALSSRPNERGEIRRMRDVEQANDFLVAVDYQLQPFLQGVVRAIAAQRLLLHHNVAIEREPDRARGILGDDVWKLVRSTSNDEGQPRWETLSVDQIAAMTEALENV